MGTKEEHRPIDVRLSCADQQTQKNMYFSQSFSHLASVSILLIIFPPLANARSCSEGFFMEASKRHIRQNCELKTLGVEFAWNFDNESQRLDIAFGSRLDSETGWLAWGLNPRGPHMVGTRALIGIKQGDDSLELHQYNITGAAKSGCRLLPSDADIGLGARNFSFVHLPDIGYYAILATVFLSKEYNSSSANIVWQIGKAAVGTQPWMHPTSLDDLDCSETVDLISGEVISFKPNERRQLRTAHGALNIIGWGIFLPTGVIAVRYSRMYPARWPWSFVFHVSCQIAGYALGLIGWIIGLWLGHKSKYYTFRTHRIIAIIIFTFTTIQMMALRLKPNSSDEYRTYWNMYHHFLGYALLAVISVNIFEGIKILETHDHSWRWSYIGVLAVLGMVALAFEIYTWFKFWRQKKKPSPKNNQNSAQVGTVQASADNAV